MSDTFEVSDICCHFLREYRAQSLSKTTKKNSSAPAAENLLEFIPRPVAQWQRDEKGLVLLQLPKFNNRFLRTHVQPRMKHPFISIHLDAFGTWVWERMDGRRTVLEIGETLAGQFGDAVEPVYERLGMFINLLAHRRFIRLEKS